ncbi:MAG: hypothetical protein J2P17_02185 [Mycobacterium sp.]|nr:hypothetical protein [Mycobacterium sp.]
MTVGARHTPGAQSAVEMLLPAPTWLGVRARRAMNRCSVISLRALADIGVSLTLGLTLVTLVWLTDALHMPSIEVATVRQAVHLASRYADLPQWWWIGLYALMTGASLVFARVGRRPDRPPVEGTFSLLSPRRHTLSAEEPDQRLG